MAIVYGTSGNDSISPPSNGATVDGGLGNDTISVSGNGSDTFLFAKGDGHDVITNPGAGYDREDTLKFTNVLATEVSLSRSGNAMTVTVPSTGDSITMNFQFWGDSQTNQNQGVSYILFADGTEWNRSELRELASMGTTGSDNIAGTSGNDVFDGRGGNDVVTGDGGNDTYIFKENYGQLTINNSISGGTAAQGQLDFGSGINEQDLWFSQTGNDLTIDRLGSSDQVTVQNWFGTNPSAQLAEIEAFDGMKLDTGAQQLVQAMATFQTSNPAFNPVQATQMPTDTNLQNALATAWHH